MMRLLTYKKNRQSRPVGILGALLLFFAAPQITHAQAIDSITSFFQFLYSFGTNPIDGLLALLGTALQKIAAFFLWIVSGIFDSVLKFTVVDLSQNITGIGAITTTWGIIRDLINISFIFILLYIAIGTILNLSGVNWKNTLVKVIVAAILINFSLFFTRTVIDVSNIIALTFYNALTNNGTVTISSAFADRLDIGTLYGGLSTAISNGTSGELILAGVGGTILILITTFVFLATTLLFVSRFVTLIFLLILSPVGFFGSVLPGLGSAASKWRSTLMGQLIFAPIFMILTWVTLQILNDPSFAAPAGATLNQAFATGAGGLPPGGSTGGFMQMFMNYAIATTFMIATLVISKSAASQGSQLGQKLTGALLGYGAASTGFIGRNTIGRGANRFMKSKYGTDLQAREDSSRMARLGLKVGRTAQTSSFDVRAARIAQKASSESGVAFGSAGGKGGFVDQKKKLDEFFGRPGSQTAKERSQRAREAQNKQAVTGGSAAAAVPRAMRTPAQQAQADQLERALGQMSPKTVEQMSYGDLSKPGVTQNLSPQQFDVVMKSDRFTDKEREAIRDVRFGGIVSAVSGGTASAVKDDIRALKTSELEHLEPSLLANQAFVEQLSDSQVDEIAKSSRFTRTQQEFVKNARTQPIIDGLDSSHPSYTPATAAASLAKLKGMNAKNLSKVGSKTVPHPTTGAPVAILIHPDMLPIYTPAKLKRLASELSDPQIQDIRNEILSVATAPGVATNPQIAATAAWLITPDGLSSFN